MAKTTIVIPGRPVPAVRMTQRGKFVRRQAQRYLAYREEMAWRLKQALEPIEGYATITVRIYLHARTETGFAGQHGDLDNYLKAACDACQTAGLLKNDRQIIGLGPGTRIYACADRKQERMEIELEPTPLEWAG